MNKQEIIKEITKFNLNSNEFIILSGAAMVLHGIKQETNDIDLAVSSRLYSELIKKYDCEFDCVVNNQNVYYFDNKQINFGLNYFDKSNVEYIDNLPVQSLDSILTLKQLLNRPKDIIDIKKIKKFKKHTE